FDTRQAGGWAEDRLRSSLGPFQRIAGHGESIAEIPAEAELTRSGVPRPAQGVSGGARRAAPCPRESLRYEQTTPRRPPSPLTRSRSISSGHSGTARRTTARGR